MYYYRKKNKPLANALRKKMTRYESILWYKYLISFEPKFYRQHMIGNYIADFYCAKAKLVVEIDGGQHTESPSINYDKLRTDYFNQRGIKVVRYFNCDILENLDGVCQDIYNIVDERLK